MRGISALIIACVYHLCYSFPYTNGKPFQDNPLILWIYRNGYVFVELFLLISGFVAFVAYTEKIDRGMSFKEFALKRVIRIFPLMIAGYCISMLFSCIYRFHFGQFWHEQGKNTIDIFLLDILGLTVLESGNTTWNNPAWSLSLFFLCWLIYYCIVYFSRSQPQYRPWICFLLVLLGIGIQRGAVNVSVSVLSSAAARGYISFFSGGILYYLQEKLNNKQKQRAAVLGIVIVSIVFFMAALDVKVGNFFIVFGAFLFPIGVFWVLNLKPLGSLLSIPPLRYLGKISFSIYLCSFPLYTLLVLLHGCGYITIDFSSGWFFFGNIALHIAVASVFYKIFEQWAPAKLKAALGV